MIAAAVTLTCSSGRAAEVGWTEGGTPATPVVVRAVLIEADSTKASAYVLVENVGANRLTVPGDLSQYVTESYRLGTDGVCVVLRELYCPGDRGSVELWPRHVYGRQVTVRRIEGAWALRFVVDLGPELGEVRSDWLNVAEWQVTNGPLQPSPAPGE
jgi:hypothetical protein